MKSTCLYYILVLMTVPGHIVSQTSATTIFEPSSTLLPKGAYVKETNNHKRAIPYTHLRESDVMWEKRVWREIDVREKQNQPLYYPVEYNPDRASLIQALSREILSGHIIAFKDEEFISPYTLSEIRSRLVKRDTLEQINYDDKGEEYTVMVPTADSTSIYNRVLKYTLKEDWFFDKQKSSLEVRVIGLAAY